MQAITAAGDAAKSALQAIRFLKKIGYQVTATQSVSSPSTGSPSVENPATRPVVKPSSKPSVKPEDKPATHAVRELKTMGDVQSFVIASTKPVVVDLFATWCIPCQRMLPIVDRLATEMAGRVTFVKINVDTASLDLDQILSKLGSDPVQGVPTFLFIKEGKEVGRVVGGRGEAQFKNEIEGALG
jgi:thioredoxin 1